MSRSLAIAYSMKKKKKASGGTVESGDETMNYSKGGDVKGVHREQPHKGRSLAGEIVRGARQGTKDKHQSMNELAKTLHQQKLDELREDKGDRRNMAEGGEVDPMMEVTCPHCAQSFSHGGQVANDTGQGVASDRLPNEFDDLVLRADDMEDAEYTGANSGDEIGNSGEDERRDDVVMRSMLKRKKK